MSDEERRFRLWQEYVQECLIVWRHEFHQWAAKAAYGDDDPGDMPVWRVPLFAEFSV